MKLTGKTVFITGGARGIGKAYAKAILEAGGKVMIADVLESEGLKTTHEFNTAFGDKTTMFCLCDVTKKEQLQDAFNKAIGHFGSIDIMINNAGVYGHKDPEVTVNVNLTAVINGSLMAIEHMRKDKEGHGGVIVNMASTAGLHVDGNEPVYHAAKHGVVGFTRSLGISTKGKGVTVVCLCPRIVETELLWSVKNHIGAEKFEEYNSAKITVDDVVEAFKALVQDEVNGAVMIVTKEGFIDTSNHKTPKNLT